MSPLAFDKQGKPFAFQRRTRKLLVRLFRNPSARGTCCQVLDADGQPLYVDPETDYAEFRKAVNHVPGLYRLDQCDEDGIELDDAQPAYVSIDVTRNVAPSGDGDPNPLVIMEHMFAIHADVMKTMASQQASLMAATAEILRAPIRPPLPAVETSKTEKEEDERDDDDDDDDSDDHDNEPADPWAAWRPLLKMAEPHLPKLGAFLYQQFATFLKSTATSSPAAALNPALQATPTVSSSPAATSLGHGSVSAAAGASVTQTITSTTPSATHNESGNASIVAASSVSDLSASSPTPALDSTAADAATSSVDAATKPSASATTATVANAPLAAVPTTSDATPRNASPIPTLEQWEHLNAIRDRLSDKERAIAENAISRMSADMLTHWLAEMSAMSVDDATRTIRDMIVKLRPAHGERR